VDELLERKPTMFGQGGRDYSVDVLRCFSCWMVIVVHTANMWVNGRYGLPQVENASAAWDVLVVIKGMFVSATTLFVMVSGIFFLSPNRTVTPGRIWRKNIAKLACAYVFWCFAYAVFGAWIAGDIGDVTFASLAKSALEEPFHLWYIPMLLSLYVIAPFVRMITAHADLALYRYGVIILTGALALNTLTVLPELPHFEQINLMVTRTPAAEVCGYVSFFILGYYLYTYRPGPSARKKIYLLGVLSVIVSSAFCIIANAQGVDAWDYHFFAKLTITTFGKNTAIFIAVLTVFSGVNFSERAKKILVKLSNTTLIVYLVHVMVLRLMIRAGFLSGTDIDPVAATLLQATITYLVGVVLAIVFQAVPWKKFRDGLFGPLRSVIRKDEAQKAAGHE
jgi:surface polysaccharide O-acyltransferase-like enzyme